MSPLVGYDSRGRNCYIGNIGEGANGYLAAPLGGENFSTYSPPITGRPGAQGVEYSGDCQQPWRARHGGAKRGGIHRGMTLFGHEIILTGVESVLWKEFVCEESAGVGAPSR